MKRLLPTLLVLLLTLSALTSCLRKPVSTTISTSRDTTTVLRPRVIPVSISADSVSSALDLLSFQDSLAAAKPGEVIRSGASKTGRTTYAIRKTSKAGQPLAFAVEVHSKGKDTLVHVTDTTRTIRLERKEVLVLPQPKVKAEKKYHSVLYYLTHPKQFTLDFAVWLWLLLAVGAALMVRRIVKAL